MKWLSLLPFVLLMSVVQAKPIKIAVIDTGITRYVYDRVKICPKESRDFTGEGINDSIGHGSHVVSLITENLKDVDYCLIILKFYSKKTKGLVEMRKALQYLDTINVDYINISAGGYYTDLLEKYNVLALLNKGIKIIAAAGNNRQDLSKRCLYYPACYDSRIIVVGNTVGDSSNFGSKGDVIDYWEEGYRCIQVTAENNICLGGTSQATAIRTGKLIKERQ